jgi:prophage maintenance system killer protein
VDGNKRAGTVAALVFLALNGAEVQVTETALVQVVLSVARGRTGKSGIAEFLRQHSRG